MVLFFFLIRNISDVDYITFCVFTLRNEKNQNQTRIIFIMQISE